MDANSTVWIARSKLDLPFRAGRHRSPRRVPACGKTAGLFKTPFSVTGCDPVAEISGHPTNRDRRVDGRTASRHFAAMEKDFALWRCLRNPAPVVVRERGRRAQQIVRGLVYRAVVGASLEQQDEAIRVFTETCGQHGAGRARTNDNIVVVHLWTSSTKISLIEVP